MPADLGVDPDAPVAIDTVLARRISVLSDGLTGVSASAWWYTTTEPPADWASPEFDASGWRRGRAGFGVPGTPSLRVGTRWDTPSIWLRTTVDLPELSDQDQLTLRLFHDEDVQVFVNGQPLYAAEGYLRTYQEILLSAEQRALFHPGKNTVAVTCRQTVGGQGIDVGLRLLKAP